MKIVSTLLLANLIGIAAWGAKAPFLVAIDPGHGGIDQGATIQLKKGSIKEKEITLALAKELSDELRRRGIQAVLTRQDDQSLSLQERTMIANRIGAHAFISIHMNASNPKYADRIEGFETYILNNSSNESSKKLAELENSVLDGSLADQFQDDQVGLIVKDLMLDANLIASQHLACNVQREVVQSTSRPGKKKRNRGVKQALFYVLLGADMPSVLLESGFIDNPRDRKLVTSSAGRKKIARGLASALEKFRDERGTPKIRQALKDCKLN